MRFGFDTPEALASHLRGFIADERQVASAVRRHFAMPAPKQRSATHRLPHVVAARSKPNRDSDAVWSVLDERRKEALARGSAALHARIWLEQRHMLPAWAREPDRDALRLGRVA